MEITGDAVEAAANQLRSQLNDFTTPDILMRKRARMVLRAAYRYLAPGIWDAGAVAGWKQSGEGWNAEYPDESTGECSVDLSENPYRVPPVVKDLQPAHSMHKEGEYFYACEACSGLPDGDRQ